MENRKIMLKRFSMFAKKYLSKQNQNMNKIFNLTIIAISAILTFFSLITFVIIQIDLLSNKFQMTPAGINNYLSAFSVYKELFAGTIALIVAYFGILRFKAAEIANKDKVSQDRFSDWKNLVDLRITEVERNNPFLKREFARLRYNLFQKLYSNKMAINNLKELNEIFDDKFKITLRFLEEMNDKHVNCGGTYRDDKFSYFFNDFHFVFMGCLDDYYKDISSDLENIYIKSLDSKRIIDINLFNSAYKSYLNRN